MWQYNGLRLAKVSQCVGVMALTVTFIALNC